MKTKPPIRRYAVFALMVVAVHITLLAWGKQIFAQANLPLDDNFWKTATADDVVAAITSGADLNLRDNGNGDTPLHVVAGHNNNSEVAWLLLDSDADIQERDKNGRTPLHAAAGSNSNPTMISLFLNWGADIRARDKEGKTPLHLVVEQNYNPEVARLLVERGAGIQVHDNSGWTPLDLAVEKSHTALINLLLKHGTRWKYEETTISDENDPFSDGLVMASAFVSKFGKDGTLEGSSLVLCDEAGNLSITVSFHNVDSVVEDSAIVKWRINRERPIEFPIDFPDGSGYRITEGNAWILARLLATANHFVTSNGAGNALVFDSLHDGENVERVLSTCRHG